MKIKKVCEIENCGKPNFTRGFCRSHWEKMRYHNDPEYRQKVKERDKEYRDRPENKARVKESQQRPENKAKAKERAQRPEHKAYMKEYHRKHSQNYTPERKRELREYATRYNNKRKEKILKHYGGKCASCGETTPEFLCIDHINNDGNIERKKLGLRGGNLYGHIIKNNFPDTYQILCFNCNHKKRIAHERETINAPKGYSAKLREEILEVYTPKCNCCGEDDIEVLAIDHVNNDGDIERAIRTHDEILKGIKEKGFPQTYQILCHNCNRAKSRKKGEISICPHKLNPSSSSQGKPQKEYDHTLEGAENLSTQPFSPCPTSRGEDIRSNE